MLSDLRRIVQEVSATPDLQTSLQIIVRRVAEKMQVAACSIYLLDAASNKYVLRAAEGLNASAVGKIALSASEGLIGLVSRRAEPVNLEHAALHPQFRAFPELKAESHHAYLGVPIIHRRRVLGVLSVRQLFMRKFNSDEEAFLVTLAAQLAASIAHADAVSAHTGTGQRSVDQINAKFMGVSSVVPGIAIGRAVVLYQAADIDAVPDRHIQNTESEIKYFRKAMQAVRNETHALESKFSTRLPAKHLALFDVYLQILDDQTLINDIENLIHQGQWAQGALRQVITQHVAQFNRMDDLYLRERGSDIRQLSEHILVHLQQKSNRPKRYPSHSILVAEDLTPAMLGEVPQEKIAGVVSISGAPYSHVALLAKALNIPAVMGAVDLPYLDLEGREMVMDSLRGELHVNPSADLKRHYRTRLRSNRTLSKKIDILNDAPCETKDHHSMQLWANISMDADVQQAIDKKADAIGLYRTEFAFMNSEGFPTEEEQCDLYRKHMLRLAPRNITMRTLDIGGDKPLAYFPIKEENPSLGWRGIRMTLDQPDILTTQVRAILKAHTGLDGKLKIMLPMVTTIGEIRDAKAIISRCHQEVVEEGWHCNRPEIGAMIEVPAAAYQAANIAREVDFLAVGSNDLTQYMLAVDRNNYRLAELYQELHPGIINVLMFIANAAKVTNREVSVCGELAANPIGCILLMAMGYRMLSASAIYLPRIRWIIQHTTLSKAQQLLQEVVEMDSAEQVIAHVRAGLADTEISHLLQQYTVS